MMDCLSEFPWRGCWRKLLIALHLFDSVIRSGSGVSFA